VSRPGRWAGVELGRTAAMATTKGFRRAEKYTGAAAGCRASHGDGRRAGGARGARRWGQSAPGRGDRGHHWERAGAARAGKSPNRGRQPRDPGSLRFLFSSPSFHRRRVVRRRTRPTSRPWIPASQRCPSTSARILPASLTRALLQEEGARGSFRLRAGGRETVYSGRLRSATFTVSGHAL
jgi:hypothetical protein